MLRAVILVLVIVAVVVGLALLPLPNSRPASAEIPTTASALNPTEIEFVQGGNVALDLQAGNYDIVPSSDNKITVNYDLSGGASARDVRIGSGVKGNNARIRIESPSNGFHAEIAVPEKTNVYVRLTAGNLDVDAIEGSKDIDVRAGNVTIDVGDPAQYGPVHGSVTTGNLQANAWSVQKSGLVRSFSTNGKGPYGLRAHIDAGNLVLVSKGK
jgi:hypothetical protein